MAQINFEDELSVDLINSLAAYKAKEAGVFGRVKLETEDIGILGAAMTDAQKTSARFLSNEISREETKEELKETIFTTVRTFLNNLADKVLDPVADLFKNKWPVIGQVIDSAKEYIKKTFVDVVVDKAKEIGTRIFNSIKEKLKSSITGGSG